MAILGLINTESFSGQRFKSVRRKVFYDMPNGAATLTGITSMLKEERASDVEYSWWEKRFTQLSTLTGTVTTAPWYGSDATTASTWGTTERSNAVVLTKAAPKVTIYVTDATNIRDGATIRIRQVAVTSGGPYDILFRVCQHNAYDVTKYLDCAYIGSGDQPGSGLTAANNTSKEVLVVGNSAAQGQVGAGRSPWNLAVNPSNYCQIFRTSFDITRTALKTSAKFDPEGVYKDRAAEASRYHMVDIERSFLFGERRLDSTGLTDMGATTGKPVFLTGGIINFLKAWEAAGSDAYYVDFPDYRGSGASAVTADSADDKRIIENTTGLIDEKTLDTYLERAFRSTQNSANEKLGFCGGVFLNVLNQLYKSKSTLQTDVPMTDAYGMDVVRHRTPFGTIWWKTHPLFNMQQDLLNSALIIDTGNIVYRYIDDTDLLENRQAMDEDARRDEWLTECGLEVRYPESMMMIKNVTGYTP